MSNKTHIKVKKENGENLRVGVIWNNNSFDITILDKENAWTSNVNEETLINLTHKLGNIQFEDYLHNLKSYLTEEKFTEISISIENNEMVLFKTGEIKIRYFYINLVKVNYNECIQDIIDDLVNSNKELHEKVTTLTKENQQLNTDKKEFEEKLTKTIDQHAKQESQLYGSFLLLLNEKKSRIQYLTELLESFKANKFDEFIIKENNNQPIPIASTSKTVQKPIEAVSDTESESEKDAISEKSYSSSAEELQEPDIPSSSTSLPQRQKRKLNTDVIENKSKREMIVEEKMETTSDAENSQVYVPSTQNILDMF